MTSFELILLPLSDKVWEEFSRWYVMRDTVAPARPAEGIWVGARAEDGQVTLVGGCCLYPCDGPFVIAEYAASNPRTPARLFHQAFHLGMTALRGYASVRDKAVFIFPRVKGIARVLAKNGFVVSPAVCMYALPGLNTGLRWAEKTPPESVVPPEAAEHGERGTTPPKLATSPRRVKRRS